MAPAASRRAPAARRRRSDVSRTIAYAVSSAPERAQDSGKRRGIIDPASISLAPASGIADSRRGERCSRRRDGEDRKSVVEGKGVSVSVDLGGGRRVKKKKNRRAGRK